MVAKPAKDGRSSTRLPRMDWYPQDYLADRRVALMTLEQRGAYTDLLWREWLDGPLPTDHRELARLLGVTPAVFRRVWKRVGECFEEVDEGLVNPRLERERKVQTEIREEKRRSASAGGRAAAASMTPEQRSDRARKAALARHRKQEQADEQEDSEQSGKQDVLAMLTPSPSPSPSYPPTPPGRGARGLRRFSDPLVRKFLRGSGTPDGQTWDEFFKHQAMSRNCGAEAAALAWLHELGGDDAVEEAQRRGRLPA